MVPDSSEYRGEVNICGGGSDGDRMTLFLWMGSVETDLADEAGIGICFATRSIAKSRAEKAVTLPTLPEKAGKPVKLPGVGTDDD